MKAFQHMVIKNKATLKLSVTGPGALRLEINTRHPVLGEHVVIELENLDKLVLDD